jgi:hypothetical protein
MAFAARLVDAALLLALGPSLAAQQPDELARLREEHRLKVVAATRLVDDVYRLTLRQMEKHRAEAGDYEGAQRAMQRLDAIEKKAVVAPVVLEPVSHLLTASGSQTRDGANTDSSRTRVEFKKTGGKASWDILSIERGVYEVFLTYSVGLPVFNPEEPRDANDPANAKPGGEVAFSEVTGLSGAGGAELRKKLTTTGHWDNFIRESLGRYECKRTPVTVRVEAVNASPSGLMHLRQVELVRLDDAQAATAVVPPTQTLKELMSKHREAMAAASAPVRARFEAEFEALENQLAAAGDAAGAAAVARARQALFKEPAGRKPEPDR